MLQKKYARMMIAIIAAALITQAGGLITVFATESSACSREPGHGGGSAGANRRRQHGHRKSMITEMETATRTRRWGAPSITP